MVTPIDILGVAALIVLYFVFAIRLHRFPINTAGRYANALAGFCFGVAVMGVGLGLLNLSPYPYGGYHGWIFSNGVWFGAIFTALVMIYGY